MHDGRNEREQSRLRRRHDQRETSETVGVAHTVDYGGEASRKGNGGPHAGAAHRTGSEVGW